jgi:hypothetical protein
MTVRLTGTLGHLVLRLCVVVLLEFVGTFAHADQHALLVGVSEYQLLGPKYRLAAPANDVRLMRQSLLQRGFDANHILVLADGVEGSRSLPTRTAILSALSELAGKARAGDTVVIHFSGHGSRQPAAPGAGAASRAGGRWQETFLPRDVSSWDDQSGVVTNAITDASLREAIDQISETGAFVWAIFDSCHSGTLVRGGGEGASAFQVSQVSPADLGVRATPPAGGPRDDEPSLRSKPGIAKRRGLATYFYAAQSGEVAVAMKLPAHIEGAPVRSLFSYQISRALATGQPMSYQQLAQHVLLEFGRLFEGHSTPLFTGDGLAEPVLGQRVPRFRQWPLDNRRGSFSVPAGSLEGLAVGALFAVVGDPLDARASTPAAAPDGYLRAIAVEPGRSLVEPVAWQGRPAPPLASLTTGAYVRLLSTPPVFTLRVAVDLAACRTGCLASAAVARLQRDGVPGVDVRWVAPGDAPDLVIQIGPDKLQYRLPGPPGDAPGSASRAPGWVLPRAGADDSTAWAQRIAADLHAIARQRNLLQLAAAIVTRPGTRGLEVSLRVRPAKQPAPDRLIGGEQVPELGEGDVLTLLVRNRGPTAVDLTVLVLDADHGITVRFPLDYGESNRIESGDEREIGDMTVNKRTTGTERLVLVWADMRKHRERRDFSFLQQSPLGRVRGAGNDAELQALIDACFADHLTRSEGVPALPADSLGMQVFSFSVRP